jgi:hypothetical protein
VTDDLAGLLARIEAQHAHKAAAPRPPRKSWRSGLEARLAEKDDEPAEFPAELEAVERAEFLQHYTTEEICAWINRACAETRAASARAAALVERMRRT